MRTTARPSRAPAREGRLVRARRGARLRPPRTHLALVPRSALLDSLDATPRQLVVVAAPPGSGKSTLLAQWAARSARPVAWLQLDGADDDRVSLLVDLVFALHGVAPLPGETRSLLARGMPPRDERVLQELLAAIEAAPPFALVLDDCQLLRDPVAWDVIAAVLEALPPEAKLALGTRAEPLLPLGRLRAEGRVSELRGAELALTHSEVRALLDLRGVSLDPASLDELVARTEGWACGVSLALLSGATQVPGAWLDGVHGNAAAIAEYLTAEALALLPAATRDFLVRTSVLETLTPALCGFVTGSCASADTLDRLARENVFVTPLGNGRSWMRLHPLFRELLQGELERRLPQEIPLLHLRAARWLAEHDDVEAAAPHWVAAGALEEAVDPLVRTCDALLLAGQPRRAARLLETLPEEAILARPSLTLAAGWVHACLPDERDWRRWTRAACRADVGEGPSPDGAASRRSSQLMFRAGMAPDGLARMLADAEQAARLEVPGDGSWRAHALTRLGAARMLTGDAVGGRQALEEAARDGDPGERAEALGLLALLATDEGRWDDAAEALRTAGVEAEAGSLPFTDVCDLTHLLAFVRLRLRAGSCPAAWIDELGLLVDERPRPERSTLLCAVVLAETALALGDLVRAERWVSRAEAVLRAYADAGVLERRCADARLALDARRLVEPLTPAERRVLELLPTHLPHGEIARALFVSRNTVRTHLRHLYAKLGVGSRGEAIERARALGVLPREVEVRAREDHHVVVTP